LRSVLGGWLFGILGAIGVTGLNIYTALIVVVIGAVIALSVYMGIPGEREKDSGVNVKTIPG
jgi:uncharacterized membrane protein YeaQ/YmgE (transglycosylase-associated protein family)